jgi:hypothetical protein
VTPQCLACAESTAVVIDLQEKPVGVIGKPAAPETKDQENKKQKKY